MRDAVSCQDRNLQVTLRKPMSKFSAAEQKGRVRCAQSLKFNSNSRQ